MITIYTLKNCDTCKKALKWLDGNGITYENHDIRADGISAEVITEIVDYLGWETALNRRSTTWRGLSDDQQADMSNAKAAALIEEYPTLLKRPVFMEGGQIQVGFNKATQDALSG